MTEPSSSPPSETGYQTCEEAEGKSIANSTLTEQGQDFPTMHEEMSDLTMIAAEAVLRLDPNTSASDLDEPHVSSQGGKDEQNLDAGIESQESATEDSSSIDKNNRPRRAAVTAVNYAELHSGTGKNKTKTAIAKKNKGSKKTKEDEENEKKESVKQTPEEEEKEQGKPTEAETKQLKEEIKIKREENDGLTTKNNELKEENEGLKTENDELKTENEELKTENDLLRGVINKEKNQNGNNQKQIASLKQQLNDAQNDYQAADKELKQLK